MGVRHCAETNHGRGAHLHRRADQGPDGLARGHEGLVYVGRVLCDAHVGCCGARMRNVWSVHHVLCRLFYHKEIENLKTGTIILRDSKIVPKTKLFL